MHFNQIWFKSYSLRVGLAVFTFHVETSTTYFLKGRYRVFHEVVNMNNSTITISSISLDLSTFVEGCLIPLVAIFGTLGNLASISVLRDKKLDMKETFR